MILSPFSSPQPHTITREEFSDSMAKFGPYEPHPHLAVAVSGGSDSLALVLLANEWVKSHKGMVTALTVDHQLRPTSQKEAHQVKEWLKPYGINTVILTWLDEKSGRRLQEKAREARYQKLEEWCHAQGVLHLLLGHHLEDQQETVMMRAEKNSGLTGLSGMSSLIEKPFYRLIRPLLTFSKERLQETLRVHDQVWIEDPSNQNQKFKRVALRGKATHFSLSELHARGQERIHYEEKINALLPALVTPFQEGYAFLKYTAWKKLAAEDRINVLQRVLMTYGSHPYPPSRESLSHFADHFYNNPSPRTLHGCLVSPYKHEFLLISREFGAIHQYLPLSENLRQTSLLWDQRFMVDLPSFVEQHHTLKALGQKGWECVKKTEDKSSPSPSIPYAVALTLPSLWHRDDLVAAPACFQGSLNQTFTHFKESAIKFLPRYPLTRFTFTLA